MSFHADDDHMGSTGGAVSYEPEARARGRRGAERPLKLVPVPSTMGSLERRPLPPLRPTRRSGIELPAPPDGPSWSPLLISLPLFAAVWVCFVLLARSVAAPPAGDVARLGDMLAVGAAVVGLVLVTLSVAHAQVSGLAPRPAVVGTLALGGVQVVAVAVLGSGLWGLAARVFALVAVTVPLASVGGQFQSGVRRHRFERDNSLVTTFTDRVRRQARATVESVHRHDVRSMLFVIEGATRVLADTALPEDQRASFTEMLDEGLGRLAKLTDVSTEEIGAFAVDDVVRAVAHAERKAGRSVMVDVPARLSAVGRAADVAAV